MKRAIDEYARILSHAKNDSKKRIELIREDADSRGEKI